MQQIIIIEDDSAIREELTFLLNFLKFPDLSLTISIPDKKRYRSIYRKNTRLAPGIFV